MTEERRVLRAVLPGLDEQLAALPLEQLESRASPAIELFRAAGGSGLLVPVEHRGQGASAATAVQVQRAIGSRCPSLAVATTMHHFSVATLLEFWKQERGMEWMLLQAIAERRLLLASGFAEGMHGQGVFRPTLRGRRSDGVVLLNGSKRPCSLARSMDILTASVAIEREGTDEPEELAIALVSADLPGVEVTPFWSTPLLAGAQSDAVALNDVAVEEDLVFAIGTVARPRFDSLQAAGFLWFELLIAASYVGAASALVERLWLEGRGETGARVDAVAELEASMAAIEGLARQVGDACVDQEALLGKVLLCRYATQDSINRASAIAVEGLGGMAFIGSSDVGYLSASVQALAFHPPSRARGAAAVDSWIGGGRLEIA